MVRQLRTLAIGVILISALILLQYRLWFQPGGVQNMQTLKKQLAKQTNENDKLKQRNNELLSQIERLQNSKEAAESRARNELGMIKKDETFYQVVH
jgi:cell division protein FtsB